MKQITKIAGAVCCAGTLAGCISSSEPMLTGAQPLLGQRLHLQLYSLRGGTAGEPEQATFVWNGKRYAYNEGNGKNLDDFTLHPFEGGGFIAQSVPQHGKTKVEYALVRTLVDGVYHVVAIDEEDADQGTRNEYCAKTGDASCRIGSPQALLAFARATAARNKTDGGLAIRLAGEKPQMR